MKCQTFPKGLYKIDSSSMGEFPYESSDMLLSVYLVLAIIYYYLVMVLICVSLITNEIKCLFVCVYWPFGYHRLWMCNKGRSPVLPSRSLTVCPFTFTPTIYLELIFIYGVEIRFLFFFPIWVSSCFSTTCWKYVVL